MTDAFRGPLAAINLPSLVQREGIELQRSGQGYKGLCPFHDERTPSFTVKGNKFHCFGCGAHGDAADFIQKLKGLSFKEALIYLGIETGRLTPEQRQRVRTEAQERKRRVNLVTAFRKWEVRHSNILGKKIRAAYGWIQRNIKSPTDLQDDTGDSLAEIYHWLSIWEDHLQVLASGTDEEKYELFEEVTHAQ